MKKIFLFCLTIYKNQRDNELLSMANALALKLVVSIFPFIIFMMTIVGFLNIDVTPLLKMLPSNLPNEITAIFDMFLKEVVYTKNLKFLSSSLLLTIFSASSGFRSAVKGLNRAYGQKETRNIVVVWILCILFVPFFALLIIASLLLLIFSDKLYSFFINHSMLIVIFTVLDGFTSYAVIGCLLFVLISLSYKLAVCVKLTLREVVPGAVFTVGAWLIMSKLFNIYINNFSKYSTIYGSIGSIFVLIYWINVLAFVFLLGGQINAVLSTKSKERKRLWK